jgi:hypothetical protein
MSFITNLKNFVKSNWTFTALVVLPVLRFLWRVFTDKKTSGASSTNPSSRKPIEGEIYKAGDVIDVEVKK